MPLMSFTGTTDFLKRPSLHAAAARFCDSHCIRIHVIARKTVFRRHQVGGNALRHEVSRDCRTRVHRPGAAGRADTDTTHRLDTAADRHVVLTGHDLRRGEIHRVETRRAEAVNLDTGHVIAVACHECGDARHAAPRLPDWIDAAHDHVIDEMRIEFVAISHRFQRGGGKVQRGNFVQRSVRLAASTRRAHVIIDECFGHL